MPLCQTPKWLRQNSLDEYAMSVAYSIELLLSCDHFISRVVR